MKYLSSVLATLSLAFLSPLSSADWYQDTQHVMGTEAHIEIWAETAVEAEQAISLVMRELIRIDRLMSPFHKDSELYRINAHAAISKQPISVELFKLINKSLFYSRLSKGAFDISFSSLGRFYDYPQGKLPNERQRTNYGPKINYRNIKLSREPDSIHFLEKGMAIDLGGIAKGHAIDKAIELLMAQGVYSALISLGGDSRIIGTRQGRPWVIGIQHPRYKERQILRIPLSDTAISTSGDYERYFMKGGERIHHIIDPSSGRSAGAVQSVSILAPLAVDSDALSTTVFVLGIKDGLNLINKLSGIDAIIIDVNGFLHYSDGLLMPSASNLDND